MMGFITHCWKNVGFEFWIRTGCLLGACFLALSQAWGQSATLELVNLRANRQDNVLVLNAQLKLELGPVVEDALVKGLAVHFMAEAELMRDRWYWFDRKVGVVTRYYRLAFQPLTRRWRLNVSSEPIAGTGLAGTSRTGTAMLCSNPLTGSIGDAAPASANPGSLVPSATLTAGKLVTPGFVDIHTHYDGQATWDPYLSPSTAHGVTSVVMGNCGMGFAPVKPDKRDWLISVMEGVEDIPGAVLSEGIQWDWESFPEYMDALARRPKALDIDTQAATLEPCVAPIYQLDGLVRRASSLQLTADARAGVAA